MKPLYFFFSLFLLSTNPSRVQSAAAAYTPAQIERVAKLSELYGHVKFFHPYMGYKPIDWDSAFTAVAPLVANAKTDQETIVAITIHSLL